MVLKKPWDTIAKALTGIGGLNLGLNEFVDINLLSYVPGGIISTAVVGLISVSGAYVLYLVYKKRI